MSEKRFVQCEIEYGFANTTNIKKIDGVYDMQEEKTYRIEQIVDKLNEQQAIIQSLKEENEKLKITLSEYGVDFSSLDRFKEAIEYNEMVKKVLE